MNKYWSEEARVFLCFPEKRTKKEEKRRMSGLAYSNNCIENDIKKKITLKIINNFFYVQRRNKF
jgi:hypothetical protein